MNRQPEQIPEKDLLKKLKRKIAPEVLKRLEALDEKNAGKGQIEDIKETNRILREKIEKNRTLLNETFQETAMVTKKESDGISSEEKNEITPTIEKKEMREAVDNLVTLEKKLDGGSTRKRMSLIGSILEKNLENTLPIILEILYDLLEKIRMGIENDGTEKCEEKVVQIVNMLMQITMKYTRIRDIQLNGKNSHMEQSYKDFPQLLGEFSASDKLSDGVDVLIQALRVDSRMLRYQLGQQILPEMVIYYYDKLIKHRKDKEVGELISIALNLACENLKNKEMQKKPTTTREKTALAFVTKFISRKK